MNDPNDVQPGLRQKATGILQRLSAAERETLLVKCWMAHDARWFAAVSERYGVEATNPLNQAASHEIGKAEARWIARALQLPPVTTLDDFLLAQEVLIGLLGPDLLDYRVLKVGAGGYELAVQRCFAYENVRRAGVADRYECGILARVTGWLEAFGLAYELSPALGSCQMSQGRACRYTITIAS